jgi:hypothetical protein
VELLQIIQGNLRDRTEPDFLKLLEQLQSYKTAGTALPAVTVISIMKLCYQSRFCCVLSTVSQIRHSDEPAKKEICYELGMIDFVDFLEKTRASLRFLDRFLIAASRRAACERDSNTS